jgi:hypothetical protein
MTRLRGLARTSAVAIALLALGSSCASHPAKPSAAAGTTTTLPASSSPVPTTSPTPTGTPVWVGPIGFVLPRGWSADNTSFGTACLEPAKQRPAYDCSGLEVWYGWDSYLPSSEQTTFTKESGGWYHNTDVQPCPVKPKDGKDGLNGLHDNGPTPAQGLQPVGSRRAYFYEWTARCENGFTFHPRAWYLPTTNVVVFDYMGYPDTAAVLNTAVYDPGKWVFGYIDGVTSSSSGNVVHIDEAQWLSGPAAEDYAHKHGQQDVPNDYIIVNDDTSTRDAPLLASATIVGNIEMAGTEPDKPKRLTMLQFIAYEQDKRHWSTTLHIHVDASGQVDQIEEQFHP